MITAEMRNDMLRSQMTTDLKEIKKEMAKLNVELELLKTLIAELKDGK
jgi:hypothetical protein